jgi:hypothetical protein
MERAYIRKGIDFEIRRTQGGAPVSLVLKSFQIIDLSKLEKKKGW